MKKLTIIRGPSGSGKSTIASSIGAFVFETDQFWVGENGYNFNPVKLQLAHKWCQNQVERAMFHSVSSIAVSNTFMGRWEMSEYLHMAPRYGYTIDVVRTPRPWNADVLMERNIHGVPHKTLQKQIAKYEEYLGETEWNDMSVFELPF